MVPRLLGVLAVCVGLAIFASAGFAVYRFATATPENAKAGQLAYACSTAMTANNVRDVGGCRCLARAAVHKARLNAYRTQAILTYFESVSADPSILNGSPPSPIQLSRAVGLVYGHPFLTSYGNCMASGFQSQAR